MDCLSVISLLIFQIVCINITTISSDQKQQLADTLNRLLQFRGWSSINDRAKYQNAADEIESFSGRDLYTFDLIEESDASMENRIVHVKNVDKKYDMIVHLLGCVYTKVMFKFLNLLHVFVLECRRAKTRCRSNAWKKVTRNCAKHEMKLTSEERALLLKDTVDLANFKTVLDMALRLLENHNLMLDCMSTALRYLIGLAPLEKMHNQLMHNLQAIRTDIDEIKMLPAFISFMVQNDNTCVNDDDITYKRKMKIFSDKVSKTVDLKIEAPFVKFNNSHCIMPDNRLFEQLKMEFRSNVIIEEMKKLENEVFSSFYSYLGFVYDFVNKSTILAPNSFLNDVEYNNVNNSDSVPNVTFP